MKILWLSNRILDKSSDKQSGTWLTTLAPYIANNKEIELANISIGQVNSFKRKDYLNIKQWIVPKEKRNKKNGLPSTKTVKNIQKAAEEFNPDIIQIWGTENYWGLLTARNLLPGLHLLNMQGLISSIERVYLGNLSPSEIIKCHGIREMIKPNESVIARKRHFTRRAIWEKEIIRNHKFIVKQSNWVAANIKTINAKCHLYTTERTLRKEFLTCKGWNEIEHNTKQKPLLFTLCIAHPFKGLHVLIKALELLKMKFPEVTLKIGGMHSKPGIKRSGYERWLRKEITKKNLDENIEWLGPLTGDEIISNMQSANVFVHPSFVESYSLAVAEAMAVGIPSVVSFSGALTELANHGDSALYFSPGDSVDCARNIIRLIDYQGLSEKISRNAKKIAITRNNKSDIVKNQIDIYKSVLQYNY